MRRKPRLCHLITICFALIKNVSHSITPANVRKSISLQLVYKFARVRFSTSWDLAAFMLLEIEFLPTKPHLYAGFELPSRRVKFCWPLFTTGAPPDLDVTVLAVKGNKFFSIS